MPDEIKNQANQPEQKKKKPVLTVLTAVLIVVLALLLLCVLPGRPVIGLVLPKPKLQPVITELDPIQFQQITPPSGGGVSTVVFPIPATSGVPVPDPFPAPVPVPPGGGQPAGEPPTTDLTVNSSDAPIQIPVNTSANLTWSTANDPDECTASGAWFGPKDPVGGSEITGPLSGPATYNYKITCSNQYGSADDTVEIIVADFADIPCTECPQPVTVSSPLVFSGNDLVSGSFPEYKLVAGDGGKVSVRASISAPGGGPCLSTPGPFQVFLYDNNVIRYGAVESNPIYGTFGGWSGNFPDFSVAPGSTHNLRLVVQTNCAGGGGAIQSLVSFSDASLTVTGPLASICQINQEPFLPLNFSNNQLVSGAFPEYKFTAFDDAIVKVNASISGFGGGPCLSPAFRVFLYDNDVLKFGPLNPVGSGWSGSFPPFSVLPGPHSIKLVVATNCAGSRNAPIQSLASISNASMNVDVEYPSDFAAPEICEQTIVSNFYDFGDAPDGDNGDFPSLLENNGARHKEQPFFLGKKVDKESDSHQVDKDSPNPAIGSDDGWDWQSLEISNVSWPSDKPIYLNALYDLNNNLKWDSVLSPIEHLVTDEELVIPQGEGIEYTLPLEVSALIPAGLPGSWIRFTLTDVKLGQNYNGSWPTAFESGETEDYSRPLIIPPTKEPPKPPKGAPPGGLLLKLPLRGQPPAVPTWLDRLLKFITAGGYRLTPKDLEVSVTRIISLGIRPVAREVFKEVKVIKEVERLVPVFITPTPKPEEPPIIQPPPSIAPTPPVSFPSVVLIQDADTNGNYIVSVTCPPAGRDVDACRLHVVGKDANNRFLYEDIFPTTNTRTFFLPLKNAIVAELFARVGSLQSSSVFAHSFVAGGVAPTPAGGVTCGTITVSASPLGPYNVTGPLPVAIGDVTMSASGGTSPYTWSVSGGSLPPTTSINSSTGVISGNATTVGNYTATIQATDANSCTGTADVNFNVSAF